MNQSGNRDARSRVEAQAGHAKILIVDDDAMIIVGLKRRLKSAGYSAVHALDGSSAIEAARQERPDLIILDLAMPLHDGFWLIEHLSAAGLPADTPIIVLTGLDSEAIRERAYKAGAVAFLSKPADEKELFASIERALANRPGLRHQAVG